MNLKQARNLAGWTQTEIAEQIGISQTAYCQIETGKSYPYKSTRDNIEKVLDVKVNWMDTRMQEGTATRVWIQGDGIVKPEEKVITAIRNYVKTGQRAEQGEKFRFLRSYIEKFQDALIQDRIEQAQKRRKIKKKGEKANDEEN